MDGSQHQPPVIQLTLIIWVASEVLHSILLKWSEQTVTTIRILIT